MKYEMTADEVKQCKFILQTLHELNRTPNDETARFVMTKWTVIRKTLYAKGYPSTLKHAIKYYVLTEGLNDFEMSEEEIALKICRSLYDHEEFI